MKQVIDKPTRFDKNSPLRDNEYFMRIYGWLLSPANTKLFDDIESFLINEKPNNRCVGRQRLLLGR